MAANRRSANAESVSNFEVKVIRYNPYSPKKGAKSNLLGFATVSINGVSFGGVRHMTGRSGNWISFPSEAVGSEYYPTVWLDLGSKDANNIGYDMVLEAIENYLADNG